jgi:hypothetical protein
MVRKGGLKLPEPCKPQNWDEARSVLKETLCRQLRLRPVCCIIDCPQVYYDSDTQVAEFESIVKVLQEPIEKGDSLKHFKLAIAQAPPAQDIVLEGDFQDDKPRRFDFVLSDTQVGDILETARTSQRAAGRRRSTVERRRSGDRKR